MIFIKKEKLISYLPNYSNINKIDKQYFLNVMNTIKDDCVNQKVFRCLQNRQNKKSFNRQNFIEL